MADRPEAAPGPGPVPPRSGPFALVLAGRTLRDGRLEPAEIGVDEDGWIRRVARSLVGDRRIDVGEAVLLPAATDLHVHFREPGPATEEENLSTGTMGAVFGGVGTVAEMPNTVPATDSVEAVADKTGRARGRLAADLLVYAGVPRPAAVPSLARHAGAFKIFLSPTSNVADPPKPLPLRESLEAIADTGLAVAVHAEDPTRFREIERVDDLPRWDAHRPPAAEAAGVDLLLPAPPALRLHVAHVTQPEIAQRLVREGHSFEATPHHLLLSTRHASGTFGKVNPPLRSEAVRAGLWAEFVAGRVPCLASDHAPHSLAAKEKAFGLAPSGMPGVETMLPLMLERVRSAELALPTLVSAACDRPARWLGLPTGRVAPGHRANLIVVDFRRTSRIRADRLHAPCGWTAFEKWPAVFPRDHFRDGARVVQDGEFVGRLDGRVVRPVYAPAPLRGSVLGSRRQG